MTDSITRRAFATGVIGVGVGVAGCSTLQEIAALRAVGFALDRITGLTLAGVDLASVRRPADLGLVDGGRVAAAFARRELPLSFDLHVLAENPASNPVTARLTQMSWTLFLQNTETVRGQVARDVSLPPGQPTDIPIGVSLNLLEFYQRSVGDLIDLALNLAGAGGEPKDVRLTAVPTIQTPIGPIAYPRPITIVSGSIG